MIPQNCVIQAILVRASWNLSKILNTNVMLQRCYAHRHLNAILAEIIIILKPFIIKILLWSIFLELNLISKSVNFKSELEVFTLNCLGLCFKVLFVVAFRQKLIVFTCP